MQIYENYDSVWNRNRVRRPAPVRSSLPPPSAEEKREEKKDEGMSSGPISRPQPVMSSGPPEGDFG